MPKITVHFLDYAIVNSGNGDGWVITKPEGKLYECNLGNYRKLEDAKRGAVQQFMIARPEEFSAQVQARMNGTHIYMDGLHFESVLSKEGLNLPPELGTTHDMNMILTFMGETI